MASTLLKEPLVHFALLGALLFGADSLRQPDTPERETISVTEGRIHHIRSVFEQTWQRAPQPQELQGLIDSYVREEILYREARNLGLDTNDTVIRRRLRQKMEYLARDLADAVEPQAEALQAFFHSNSARYRTPVSISFSQLFFNPSLHDDSAAAARDALHQLHNGMSPDTLGDSTLLATHYPLQEQPKLVRLFGGEFAGSLDGLPRGQWSGPVRSGFGWHLVHIEEIQPSTLPPLESVRATVLRDWQTAEQERILQAQYEQLRSRYQIDITPYNTLSETVASQ